MSVINIGIGVYFIHDTRCGGCGRGIFCGGDRLIGRGSVGSEQQHIDIRAVGAFALVIEWCIALIFRGVAAAAAVQLTKTLIDIAVFTKITVYAVRVRNGQNGVLHTNQYGCW